MIWKNTRNRYGLVQIVLHWLSFALIAALIPLGLWMTGLDYYDAWYKKGPDLHRAIGILLGILILIRLLARLSQTRPEPLNAKRGEALVARLVHRLLYLLPLLLVTSGYLLSTADGRSVEVFDWFSVPATLHGLEHQEDIAGDIHFALAMLLLGVVALHVLAAIRHHFVLKDATLRRMLTVRNAN